MIGRLRGYYCAYEARSDFIDVELEERIIPVAALFRFCAGSDRYCAELGEIAAVVGRGVRHGKFIGSGYAPQTAEEIHADFGKDAYLLEIDHERKLACGVTRDQRCLAGEGHVAVGQFIARINTVAVVEIAVGIAAVRIGACDISLAERNELGSMEDIV